MNKITAVSIFSFLIFLGCDDQSTASDDAQFRGAYWAAIECDNGTCWGLHPVGATDDLWVKLIHADQLNAWVSSGRFVPDTATVGFGGCAWGEHPITTPEVHCWTINGTTTNRCFGGDGIYFTEIKAECEQVPGFLAANTHLALGSCDDIPQQPWYTFDWLMGHSTKLNVARAGLDGDSFLLYPGCAIP
jgi:hypothetical protein